MDSIITVIGMLLAFYLGASMAKGQNPVERIRTRVIRDKSEPEVPAIIENQMDVNAVLNIDPPDLFGMRKAKETYEKQLEIERRRAL